MRKQNLFMVRILIALLVCALTSVCWAQDVTPSESLSLMQHNGERTIFTFNYPSINAQGNETVLSAALIAWTPTECQEDDCIESVHIYCHATITSDSQRPTTTSSPVDRSALMAMIGRQYDASGQSDYVSRCIIIAPDYEGYGATKTSPHPYLSQKITARQVTDAVTYGLQLYRKAIADGSVLDMKSDWRSFAYGYSQGGAVALATQRHIEEEELADELHFKGSICGDGPYDLIATLRYYLEDNGTSYGVNTTHQQGFCTLPVVMPLILQGMMDTHPAMKDYTISDLLSQQMLDTGIIDWIESKTYSTDDIAKKWYQQLQEGIDIENRHYTPAQMADLFLAPKKDVVWGRLETMLTPEVYNYLSQPANFDEVPNEPINVAQALHSALVDNSLTTGWSPIHRIQFLHSRADMVVPYSNYLSMSEVLPEEDLYRIDDTFSSSDHVDAGVRFFMNLALLKTFGTYFDWLCEQPAPTGINAIDDWTLFNSQFENDAWYDLSGRRLTAKPTNKGIYIYKGKKFVNSK